MPTQREPGGAGRALEASPAIAEPPNARSRPKEIRRERSHSRFTRTAAVATAALRGLDVEEAYTRRDAIDAVKKEEPDLIVLDWMLPDIEGIEVGRRLRACGFKSRPVPDRQGRDGE